ncbi:rod shape-determining protein MreC [Adlercreutzia agrestimuris]|uniref:rod shape-determining protein MreC n=1 Tax=Adlercreutzia agrestimuris TaxID=2941324 RepID=UPI00203D4507|nr:rod shape-determining protein MreC [Adlercreutzia agrestimuris]
MALNFQQSGSVFVRRVLLIVFLVASLVMMLLYAREGESGVLHKAQAAFSGITAPLDYAGAVVSNATENAADGIENITASDETLSGLRDYNAELVEQYAKAEEYAQENERLRQLLDLKDTYHLEGVGARVIGRSSQAWSQTITLDKGEADGVDTGLTVMGTSGVVGQVISTTSHTSVVRLLTDPQSGAAAMIQSSRVEGIVRGSLEGLLYLEGLPIDAEINPGDIVLTSGLGGSYAKGLLIGTIVTIDERSGHATRRAVVSANSEAQALEEVLVVFSADSPMLQDKGDQDGDGADKALPNDSQNAENSSGDGTNSVENTEGTGEAV